MAVDLGSGGSENPVFKAQIGRDVNVSSGDVYENLQRIKNCEQQKPNSHLTPKEAAAMMPNVKVHLVLVLVSVGILSVLLLVSIGFFSWAGWKVNQLDEAFKKHSEEMKDLEEKSQNETEKLNQKIQLIQKFNAYPMNEQCNGSECLLCQRGWIFFNESCYLFSDVWSLWNESRQFCQFKSADLIVIDNHQEQKFIYYNLKSIHWFGLYKSGSDWIWIDNRNDTLKFWYPSYPRSSHSNAIMSQSGNPTESWFSVPSTYGAYPICEQKASKVSLN
ncbi:natural killer cells antigen CD94-like [Gambusia affinis]|uniref:natural killer cells antigen CD94-like n=1 Tax=Gambusia affinis TaxID=33528 RepID=UPI001CDC6B11|nr:natural killer cells antigen CD94-like [Gambusia affinis]